ncbi:MAG: tetratricopeptide repeat protein [Armatimonadota bacterium]
MDEDRNILILARHYLEMDNYSKALDTLENLPEMLLNDSEHWVIRGHALYGLKHYKKAAEAAITGLSYYPEDPQLLYLHCLCQDRMHNLEEAERAILALLSGDPGSPQYICRYAYMAAEAGQLDKADALIDEALRIVPDYSWAMEMRVMLSHMRCDNKGVVRWGRKLLDCDPENQYGHRMLGKQYLNKGKVTTAASHYRTAARIDPNDIFATKYARESSVKAHWLMWPIRPFYRITGIIGIIVFYIRNAARTL